MSKQAEIEKLENYCVVEARIACDGCKKTFLLNDLYPEDDAYAMGFREVGRGDNKKVLCAKCRNKRKKT